MVCGDSVLGASPADIARQPPGAAPRTSQHSPTPLFVDTELEPTLARAVDERRWLAETRSEATRHARLTGGRLIVTAPPRPDAEQRTRRADELRELVAHELGRPFKPSRVVFVPALSSAGRRGSAQALSKEPPGGEPAHAVTHVDQPSYRARTVAARSPPFSAPREDRPD